MPEPSHQFDNGLGHVAAFAHDPVPPHEQSSDEHDGGHHSENGPERLQPRPPYRIAPAAEVQTRQPLEGNIAGTLTVGPFRIREALHKIRQRIRYPQIPAGDPPHQHEEEQPESERAVQIPIEAPPPGRGLDPQAPFPSRDAGPPHDAAAEHNDSEDQTEQPIPPGTFGALEQQIVVEARQPYEPALSLGNVIAKV